MGIEALQERIELRYHICPESTGTFDWVEGVMQETLTVKPGPRSRTVRRDTGEVLEVPDGWSLLPPGDATLTRRVKKAGPSWTVKEKRGRREFSQGVWAPSETIETLREALVKERESPAYQQRLERGRARRAQAQVKYAEDFESAVFDYLRFPPAHEAEARQFAAAVAAQATPVGSGRVGRTRRITLEERVEAAVIAWLRHHTTTYDHMKIARVKGRRRQVRRALARGSRELLETWRRGTPSDDDPLRRALKRLAVSQGPAS